MFAVGSKGLAFVVILGGSFALGGCGGESAEEPSSAAVDTPGSETAQPASEPESEEENPLGEPRDDLERFYGVYGSEDQPNRDFFVAKAKYGPGVDRTVPDGYLMVGAMWGDVAPWFMKSLSETEFEQAYTNPGQQEPIKVAFELDDQGNPVAMTFTSGFGDRGRLAREGDLPEGW